MVVGTTGWYDKLADMRGLAERKQAGLLYGTNYSLGVQVMLQLAAQMGESLKDAGYKFSIEETHHVTKLDSPRERRSRLAEMVRSAAGVESRCRSRRCARAMRRARMCWMRRAMRTGWC